MAELRRSLTSVAALDEALSLSEVERE